MPKTTSKKGRRQEQRDNYLAGNARRSYKCRSTLHTFLEEDGREETRTNFEKVCPKCRQILSLYKDMFVELTHRGSDLKKRKHARSNPKRPNSVPYRDIKRQNDWISENLCDPMGNYLFDNACIRAALGVSKQRLTRLRGVKRKQLKEPLRDMTKADVEKERISEYVVMPSDKKIESKKFVMLLKVPKFTWTDRRCSMTSGKYLLD